MHVNVKTYVQPLFNIVLKLNAASGNSFYSRIFINVFHEKSQKGEAVSSLSHTATTPDCLIIPFYLFIGLMGMDCFSVKW